MFNDQVLDIQYFVRFGEESLHAGRFGSVNGIAGDICRYRNDLRRFAMGFGDFHNLGRCFVAVHVGHPNVHEDGVKSLCGRW